MTIHSFKPGKHVLLDFYEASNLSDQALIETALAKAASACGATVLNIQCHGFGDNAGITGVALLAESHISIHTWPEYGYAAIDIFMCGNCDAELAIEPLASFFKPAKRQVKLCHRGEETLVERPRA